VRGQDDDRERAAGPCPPLGEVWCAGGDLRPQLVLLGVTDKVRVNVVLPLADPNVAPTCRFEVQKPLRGFLGAAHPRSYDDVVAVVVEVGDRDGVRRSALAAGHGQQQQWEPPHPAAADPAVCAPIQPDIGLGTRLNGFPRYGIHCSPLSWCKC
jgi:hypothetical protein